MAKCPILELRKYMQDTKPVSPTKGVWPSQDTLNKRKPRGTRERKGKKEGETVNTQNPAWRFHSEKS